MLLENKLCISCKLIRRLANANCDNCTTWLIPRFAKTCGAPLSFLIDLTLSKLWLHHSCIVVSSFAIFSVLPWILSFHAPACFFPLSLETSRDYCMLPTEWKFNKAYFFAEFQYRRLPTLHLWQIKDVWLSKQLIHALLEDMTEPGLID